MYILKVEKTAGWSFGTYYYEYMEEAEALEVARSLASKGVNSTLFKPYKKFERPKPEVVEMDV